MVAGDRGWALTAGAALGTTPASAERLMRLLVTIPHYCKRAAEPPADAPADPLTVGGAGAEPLVYASESGNVAARLRQVERCLTALHQTFGSRQSITWNEEPIRANTTLDSTLSIALVTTGTQHLAAELPEHLFMHFGTDVEPRHLGFACHQLMRENAGRYDYYAYLEDDIEITDPLFFEKLRWFSDRFGHSALLQPNRFETAPDLTIMKLYVDGDTAQRELPARYQDINTRRRVLAEAFGRSFMFQRVDNVHSGCFFLSATQFARVAASPKFGSPTDEFFRAAGECGDVDDHADVRGV